MSMTAFYSEETTAVMDDLDVMDTFFSDHSCTEGEDDEFEFELDDDDDDS